MSFVFLTRNENSNSDSHQAAVARISALTRVNRRAANPPKDFPAKLRGNKVAAAPEENAIEVD
jgi:hypothetical protein